MKFRELTDQEYKRKFVSPREMLEKEAGLAHQDQLLIMNSHGWIRDASQPAFTVTGNPQKFGTRHADMETFETRMLAKMMQV